METESLPVSTPETANPVVERLSNIINLIPEEKTDETPDQGQESPPKVEVQPEEGKGTPDGASPSESEEGSGEEDSDAPLPKSWGDGVKTATLKVGDKEYSIPEDAKFEVTVDKKTEVVPLDKLKEAYNGKQAYGRHLGELKQKTRQVEAKEAEIQAREANQKEKVNSFLTKAKTNPFGAMVDNLLESGVAVDDISHYIRGFFSQVKVTADTMFKMNPEQVEARIMHLIAEAQHGAVKKQREEFESQRRFAEENQQIANYIISKQKEFGISDDEMSYALEVVSSSDDFKKKTKTEIADDMVRFINDFHRPFQQIRAATERVAPELIENDKFHKALFEVTQGKNLTDSQLDSVIKAYLRDLSKTNGSAPPAQKPETRNGAGAQPNKAGTPTPTAPAPAETKAEDDDLGPFSARDLMRRYS